MRRAVLILGAAAVIAACIRADSIDYTGPVAGWSHWGGTEAGQRYSPLTQITPANVRRLRIAWQYRIGAAGALSETPTPVGEARRLLAEGMAPEAVKYPTLEATPILAEGRLYLCSNRNRIVALDPETGRELWSHDPQVDSTGVHLLNCRGVSYFRDFRAIDGAACRGRIFSGTLDGRLIALDSATGVLCPDFGEGGTVNLRAGLGRNRPGDFSVTSPPTVIADRVIIGGRVEDGFRTDMPAGVVRAFDARTGALAWAWNPVPAGRFDHQTQGPDEPYVRATPNAWSVFSSDADRGLVFIPTGNSQVDIFGGDRGGLDQGMDHYSSSVVALHASTGKVAWNFQTVHHDIWDYDVSSQPVLFDLPTANGLVPALVQATKQGHLFILHRETGEPLYPVEERPVPQSGLAPGEYLSPTQPFPANDTFVLRRPSLSEAEMWGFTPWDRAKCRELFRRYRYQGVFTPPSTQGSITYPNNLGISNWGSLAMDVSRNLLLVNTSHVASVTTLIPRREADERIARGEFMMPQAGTPYAVQWAPLLSPWGAPCNRPPWGTLVAIDLRSGKRVWESPLGSTRDLAPFPLWLKLGTPNLGGPVVTASGLTFIGATTDNFLRAFDTSTGQELWKGRLPAGPQSTPMTYRLSPRSRQFVVIAAGGHAILGTTPGDYLVAFAL